MVSLKKNKQIQSFAKSEPQSFSSLNTCQRWKALCLPPCMSNPLKVVSNRTRSYWVNTICGFTFSLSFGLVIKTSVDAAYRSANEYSVCHCLAFWGNFPYSSSISNHLWIFSVFVFFFFWLCVMFDVLLCYCCLRNFPMGTIKLYWTVLSCPMRSTVLAVSLSYSPELSHNRHSIVVLPAWVVS